MNNLILPKRRGQNRIDELKLFSEELQEISKSVGYKMSARGWCYILEDKRYINKSEFDCAEKIINECRKNGYLPLDFTSDSLQRSLNIVNPDVNNPYEYISEWVNYVRNSIADRYILPAINLHSEYSLFVVTEKIDLYTLFKPLCKQLQIPIMNLAGWSDINSRGNIIKFFKESEERGKIPVLLYAGDFDSVGLQISDTIRKNLNDLSNSSLANGWNANNLIVDRFGLNYDFIKENNLTWIDNLETGSGGCVARFLDGKIIQGRTKDGKPHPDFFKPHTQSYLKNYGVRKVEANALVVVPEKAYELIWNAITKYILSEDIERYNQELNNKRQKIRKILDLPEISKLFNQINKNLKREEMNNE